MSLWLGLFIFALFMGLLGGADLLGWAAKTNVWTTFSQIVEPVSRGYAGVRGVGSLLLTFLFLLVVMSLAAKGLAANVRRFALGFVVIFAASYACWVAGHFAHVAATPDKLEHLGISWSLNLTGEAGYILALLAGLVVGDFLPKTATRIAEATKPELYIKTAIVIMGAGLGVKAVEALSLASAVIFRGLCAIVEA